MSDRLAEAAREAKANAYAPYSGFRVGAAVLAEDGRVFRGANVENASYGLSLCAERVAIAAGVAAGARRFERLVVVSDADPPSAPCGACRQLMAEMDLELKVEAVGPNGAVRRWRVAELLPDRFGPEDLAP